MNEVAPAPVGPLLSLSRRVSNCFTRLQNMKSKMPTPSTTPITDKPAIRPMFDWFCEGAPTGLDEFAVADADSKDNVFVADDDTEATELLETRLPDGVEEAVPEDVELGQMLLLGRY